jgi:hypothetical protein
VSVAALLLDIHAAGGNFFFLSPIMTFNGKIGIFFLACEPEKLSADAWNMETQ